MVEPQPSKLMVRVRSPSPAPLNGGSQGRLSLPAQRVASFCEKSGMDAELISAVREEG